MFARERRSAARRQVKGGGLSFSFAFPEVDREKTEGGGGEADRTRLRDGLGLTELSMGMSNDFEIGIEEIKNA